MKLGLSLTSVMIGFSPEKEWVILYVLSAVPGTVGTIFLAASYFNGAMKIVTGVFAGVGFLICFAVLGWGLDHHGRSPGGMFGVMLAAMFGFMPLLGAVWSDWVLAVIADNTAGYPYRSNKAVQALWVVYWIGKRLGLFML